MNYSVIQPSKNLNNCWPTYWDAHSGQLMTWIQTVSRWLAWILNVCVCVCVCVSALDHQCEYVKSKHELTSFSSSLLNSSVRFTLFNVIFNISHADSETNSSRSGRLQLSGHTAAPSHTTDCSDSDQILWSALITNPVSKCVWCQNQTVNPLAGRCPQPNLCPGGGNTMTDRICGQTSNNNQWSITCRLQHTATTEEQAALKALQVTWCVRRSDTPDRTCKHHQGEASPSVIQWRASWRGGVIWVSSSLDYW